MEELAEGERSAGELVEVVGAEFGITQSAVSQQLQTLREHGFVTVRPEGRRRMYAIEPEPFKSIGAWLAHYGAFWEEEMDDLAGELERARAERADEPN